MSTAHVKISKHAPSPTQGRLNLAAVTKPRQSLAIEYPVERVILRALLVALVALVLCYLYFVFSSVVNIMASKEAMAKTASINASISSLETQYFALSQQISQSSALAIGLTPIHATDYVDRPGNVSMGETQPENRI